MLSQRMGMPLSELGQRMSSNEFSLHLALEIRRADRAKPKDQGGVSDWDDL
jgi:hypothetical protein